LAGFTRHLPGFDGEIRQGILLPPASKIKKEGALGVRSGERKFAIYFFTQVMYAATSLIRTDRELAGPQQRRARKRVEIGGRMAPAVTQMRARRKVIP
jgi:hypothetical protein